MTRIKILLIALAVALSGNIVLYQRLHAMTSERSALVKELGGAWSHLRRTDSTLSAVRMRVDTQRVLVARWTHDTTTAWRRDTIVLNGEARVAVPLPVVAQIVDGQRACQQLDTLVSLERSACDSTIAARDSVIRVLTAKVLTEQPTSSVRPTLIYGTALAVAVEVNKQFHIDVDRGGYVDSWRTPDKQAHAAFGAVLSMTAMEMGVRPRNAVLLTCAGASAFEWSQGQVSGEDIVAGCGGALAGVGLMRVAHWLGGRR